MHACRPRRSCRTVVEPLERRTLFAAAVTTVPLTNNAAYSTTLASDVTADAAGNVYATRTGGDGTGDSDLVEIPVGATTPTVLASFAPLIEYAGSYETPVGQMVVDSAGDLFGITRFSATQSLPDLADDTRGLLWELPAGFHVIDVLARFSAAQGSPTSLTVDGSGNLYGTVDPNLVVGTTYAVPTQGGVFIYPADETGLVVVPVGDAGTLASDAVADTGGDVFGTLSSADDPTGAFSLFELRHGSTTATVLEDVPTTVGSDVAGLMLDKAGNLFATTEQGPGGGALLELPVGGSKVEALLGGGQSFIGAPLVDGSGNVFATTADGTLLERPAGGVAFESVVSLAPGTPTDLSLDAYGNVFGIYEDPTTSQATVFKVSGAAITPTTPVPTPTPTQPTTGLQPIVTRSSLPARTVAGARVKGTVTVKLTNTTTTVERGLATIAVFATQAGVTVSAGTEVLTVYRKVKLAVGASTAVTLPFQPTLLTAGTYQLLALAIDNADTLLEATTGPTVTAGPAAASLSAAVAASPKSVVAGAKVTLTLMLTATGNIDSTGPLSATLGLSVDGRVLTVPLGTITRTLIEKVGGKPVVVKVRLTVPLGTAAGSYVLVASIVQGSAIATAVGTTAVSIV